MYPSKTKLVEKHKTADGHTLNIFKSKDGYPFKYDGVTIVVSDTKKEGLLQCTFALFKELTKR